MASEKKQCEIWQSAELESSWHVGISLQLTLREVCQNRVIHETKLKIEKIFLDEIANESGNQNIVCMKLDLSSLQSVREFAKDFNAKESRLDVLIHNAGYANTFDKAVSVDGLELTMATNHYGPFLLTHLLIDLLKKSAPARIVVVASSFYRLASVNLNNLNPIDGIPWYLYYMSKACNIMFTTELAKRLEGTNITVNCLHPGEFCGVENNRKFQYFSYRCG